MPTASVIIPTRNKARFLAYTLASLERQTERDFEVVITDDGSDDDTRDVATASQHTFELRYIRRAHQGRAAARNAAIRAARGELLIFCDDDRIADGNFVADHIAAHADGTSRVVLGGQRGIVTLWSREWSIAAVDLAAILARAPELAPRFAEAHTTLTTIDELRADFAGVTTRLQIVEPWWQRYVAPVIERHGTDLDGFAFPWTTAATGNLSVSRTLVERVGMFDETFVGWGLEDTELHLRLHRAGAHTRVIAGGLNWHQVHARPSTNANEWGRNAMRMLDKHSTLDVCLYIRAIRGRITFDHANKIYKDADALGAGASDLITELVEMTREQLRVITAL